jgi:hypothetical protein
VKVKLFLRKDSAGHTVIIGKILGKVSEYPEAIFAGSVNCDENLMVFDGTMRLPDVKTECKSIRLVMAELGEL